MHPHSHPCPHFVLCGAVEDIIWEVDEDANGWIDWENFVQMYIRCQNDRTGREPTRLFNLVEFMICDKDGGGTMSEDECMEILYHRFGKEVMMKLTDQLFKRKLDEAEKEFTFTEFLNLVDSNTGILAAHMRAQKEQTHVQRGR